MTGGSRLDGTNNNQRVIQNKSHLHPLVKKSFAKTVLGFLLVLVPPPSLINVNRRCIVLESDCSARILHFAFREID
eukprot:COSAG02_NODE_5143_length_4594_cov_5.994438_1_plen_75_part_10